MPPQKPRADWYSKVYKPHDHSGDFYSSPEWLKLRRECFYRDLYRCIRCDKRFKVEHLTAHHIRPRNEGGDDILENLTTLCDSCHDFVEVEGHKTLADIIGSYDKPLPESEPEPKNEPQDQYKRPEWHKWVYGGVKRKH